MRHDLEINWKAVHAEILKRLKDLSDLLPQQTRRAYLAYNNFQRKGLAERRFSSNPSSLASMKSTKSWPDREGGRPSGSPGHDISCPYGMDFR